MPHMRFGVYTFERYKLARPKGMKSSWSGPPKGAAAQPQAQRVKFTRYFQEMSSRADRAIIKPEWIQRAIDQPIKEVIQADGRIRRWAQIPEMEGKYLRVILLSDGETVHNAFFDRSFKQ